MKTNMRYFATAFVSMIAVCLYAQSVKPYTVGITMPENAANLTALQFDVQLPAGVTIAEDQEGSLVTHLGIAGTDHQFRVAKIGENTYRFLAYSMTNAQLPVSETPLVSFTIKAANNLSQEEQGNLLSKALVVKTNAQPANLAESAYEVESVLHGDVNKDSQVDTQDAILVIQRYLGDTPSGFSETVSDMNNDGNIDTQDAILIIERYLSNE